MTSILSKLDALQILNEKVCKCEKCPELVENRTQTVFDSGNPYAKIVILAESPGREEDKQGEVLIGPSGQLLNKMLEKCGLDRKKDVYLCNILKCRPPGNRNPYPYEASNCRKYLDIQLDIVNPEFILCLGKVALYHLLGLEEPFDSIRMRDYRGRVISFNSRKVVATFHPSYCLRNPAAKLDVYEDLKFLMGLLNE